MTILPINQKVFIGLASNFNSESVISCKLSVIFMQIQREKHTWRIGARIDWRLGLHVQMIS